MKSEALRELERLDLEDRLKKYPNAPAHAIAPARFNDRTSNGLTQCILRWLRLKGFYAVRVTTTGRKLKDTFVVDVIGRTRMMAGQWIPGTTRTGTADIHAVINGRHCSIEVKVSGDRMSMAQEKTRKDVERAGGSYIIASDFQTFYIWFKNLISEKKSST
jgi:Holliday junction resolvase